MRITSLQGRTQPFMAPCLTRNTKLGFPVEQKESQRILRSAGTKAFMSACYQYAPSGRTGNTPGTRERAECTIPRQPKARCGKTTPWTKYNSQFAGEVQRAGALRQRFGSLCRGSLASKSSELFGNQEWPRMALHCWGSVAQHRYSFGCFWCA